MFFSVCHTYAQLVYHDASKFPLLGKATEATGARYERLPDSLKNISRAPLWNLSRNSAGMAIRFRSNSTTIAAKWETLINFHMNHMTDTGAKGLDLYCLQKNGEWRFVNSGRPGGKTNQATIIANMRPELSDPQKAGCILWHQYSSRRLCFTSRNGTYKYHIEKAEP